ncbi:hypothetical protein M431DRAFT_501517 [Trichoderma harzianum CBS 226.95]|uniref:Uncharacterized protein n=1 Tax=Trichoderma harzianum CBS 226.95 TaxID=983964 RepID=A0A2T3ZTF8_TRIHA|nr:hypothetical protein M431DRAFT_501517 [Trichoderma harzianum CBS 226.95]PTB48092.1 hypothetical protein M431DRAFT_501517 [Trichoderma harzianum CBS 226.95]
MYQGMRHGVMPRSRRLSSPSGVMTWCMAWHVAARLRSTEDAALLLAACTEYTRDAVQNIRALVMDTKEGVGHCTYDGTADEMHKQGGHRRLRLRKRTSNERERGWARQRILYLSDP